MSFAAFVKGEYSSKFPSLTIKYVRGADPRLKMMDADGAVKEELSITQWDTDTVDEYLLSHLTM